MSLSTGAYRVRSCNPVDPLRLGERGVSDFPDGFAVQLRAQNTEIDAFGHVNNTIYQRWMEACAWAHSASVGLDPLRCRDLGRGMALKTVEIDYLEPGFEGQAITVVNWITKVDRLRAERRFQILVLDDGATLARGRAAYVCIDLATGAPARMPPAFVAGYVVQPRVRAALDGSEPH